MREFNNVQDSFKINGRGTCFSSSRWKMAPGEWDPDCMVGETVLLCGTEVKIRGVDTFCIPRSPSAPYPYSFAIMVSDEDAERVQWKS